MAKARNPKKCKKKEEKIQKQKKNPPQLQEKQHSWAVVRSLFTCKHLQTHIQQQQQQQQPQQQQQKQREEEKSQPPKEVPRKKQQQQVVELETNKKCKKMKCSGSLCSNTKVMHRPEGVSPDDLKKRANSMGSSNNNNNNDISSRSMKVTLNKLNNGSALVTSSSSSSSSSLAAAAAASSSSSSSPLITGSFKAMPFRKLSGCYECRMVVDPVLGMTRDPSLRATISPCPDCGEIFMKAENLELHQATRHAVSELGPEDTSKNIVEIIFQSSWLKKQTPVCKIDRILKVRNTSKTISKFEEYREAIKAKPSKKNPRCVADGNELLRFHSTTFMCSLGLNGSSNLCNSIPHCGVCSIIKNGFKISSGEAAGKGILTTATSGKAHDSAAAVVGSSSSEEEEDGKKRAMLVCRVIAGRVKKNLEGNIEEYDSLAGPTGVYSNLDELYVFNPKAILPCFVVIYQGF